MPQPLTVNNAEYRWWYAELHREMCVRRSAILACDYKRCQPRRQSESAVRSKGYELCSGEDRTIVPNVLVSNCSVAAGARNLEETALTLTFLPYVVRVESQEFNWQPDYFRGVTLYCKDCDRSMSRFETLMVPSMSQALHQSLNAYSRSFGRCLYIITCNA